MRPLPAPADPARHEHTPLLLALASALGTLDRRDAVLAVALAELGDIDLPAGAPRPEDRAQLEAAGPLYFASELEAAGLLPTAELVTGLFASGAITQPLGPTAQLLHTFWRGRRDRLDGNEREALFARVIEPPHFDRLMAALCSAIVAQASVAGFREQAALSHATESLAEFLSLRVDAMASFAVRDIIAAINAALGFMRDRMLQTAFGVRSLWQLVAVAGAVQGQSAGSVQRHVEQGRSGQTVLTWLAGHYLDDAPRLDGGNPADMEVIAAAARWLGGRAVVPAYPGPPGAAAAMPVAA
ncbi:MAG: hypothetical protein M3Q42_02135 [Pseudomonadota bacterium]|nr:hypothetical protein [Pseudomonadota bacterium]